MQVIDLRDEMIRTNAGAIYDWRPLSSVRYIVIHHMGADYDGDAVAATWATDRYHREHNGWSGGFGYHMTAVDGVVVIGGDLATSRANVWQRNPECIGILWPRNGDVRTPEPSDLDAIRAAIAFAKEVCPQALVVGHKDIALDGTACPGTRWSEWGGLLT